MQYDFDEIIDRAGTNSIKFEAFRHSGTRTTITF